MMKFRNLLSIALGAVFIFGSFAARAQQATSAVQSDLSPAQRVKVMRSKLDAMRRSLNSAVSSMNAQDSGAKENKKAAPDDPRERLRGLTKEVDAVLSDVSDIAGKQDRSERYEVSDIGKLEASVVELDTRVQAGLRDTASLRTSGTVASSSGKKSKKKKGHLFGLIGGGSDDKYQELTDTVAPGRDRELFEEAARQVHKGNYDTGRLLFNTIITTYPDSPFLPLSKLAIADSFYLEGSTSALVQAAGGYQDWLTFFPTDPLADDAMLKMAEAEMRQMGLPDREIPHARKAEQRLKVLLQQFPNTPLKDAVQLRLNEVQENLAMHDLQVGRFYASRNDQGKGGLKGAQSRLRDIVVKYPNFSYMDEVLFRLGALYVQEEEPDEAAKYYQQIARDYPNSEFAEKAREQLQVIGAAVPAPDPNRAKIAPPQRPSFTQNLMEQVLGTTQVTVDKNGVIISKDDKQGDLIDAAIRNNGQVPSNLTPNAPVERRAPARNVQQSSTPTPVPSSGASNSKIKITPTASGAPADRLNPSAPVMPPNTSTVIPAPATPQKP
jgi:outer membrane protein assembly factor BamD